MGTLTVRENLHFSASLRLPGRLSKQQREERVEATLSDLGLYHVAESKVCLCTAEKPWRRGEGRGEIPRLPSKGAGRIFHRFVPAYGTVERTNQVEF